MSYQPPPRHWVVPEAEIEQARKPRGSFEKAIYGLAAIVFATESGPPPEARLCWLVVETVDFVSRIGARSRFIFRLSLFVTIWLSPLLSFRPGPLHWYRTRRRAQILERFERSFAGASLLAVKAILSIMYFEHPDSAAELGFDGACLGQDSGLA
mgnify:CR=1 FL=1